MLYPVPEKEADAECAGKLKIIPTMVHFAVDQERRVWGNSINEFSTQIRFRYVAFTAVISPADSKCHNILWKSTCW